MNFTTAVEAPCYDAKPDEERETEPLSVRPVDWDVPRDWVCNWDALSP